MIYGVTIDNATDGVTNTIDALKSLPQKMYARVVFDENVPASSYIQPVQQLSTAANIMGEILDSQYVKKYSIQAYIARTQEYINTLKPYVQIWEIANEINGDWLGNTADVVAKISGAFDVAKAAGVRTALTLYLCYTNQYEMISWAQKNIPDKMKSGLDYVFISYYIDDCPDIKNPDWNTITQSISQIFPNAMIGIGESGTDNAAKKEAYMKQYYSIKPNSSKWIGGYFWWYFAEDCVPKTKPLWKTLETIVSGGDNPPNQEAEQALRKVQELLTQAQIEIQDYLNPHLPFWQI